MVGRFTKIGTTSRPGDRFCKVLQGSTWFCKVLQGSVLQGSTMFYEVVSEPGRTL
jgi:hypothetical protein